MEAILVCKTSLVKKADDTDDDDDDDDKYYNRVKLMFKSITPFGITLEAQSYLFGYILKVCVYMLHTYIYIFQRRFALGMSDGAQCQ